MGKRKKINVIIDTDPGVDDVAAISLSLYDDIMDIKMISTVNGNLDLETVTRNMMHVLELFNRTDIPVYKGAAKAMCRVSPDARFIHKLEGMGGYLPPKTVTTQPQEGDAVEKMYETIVAHKNDISIIAVGPLTNIGLLISRHPDVVGMINHIYTEGCSPYGWKRPGKWSTYISFNASSDPEALKIVVESGIPVTMVESMIGREVTNFTEEEVNHIGKINDVGRFLAEMYSNYWEFGYADRRIATNDTCACMSLRFPELFKTKKASFNVNTTDAPGKTVIELNKNGNVNFITKVNKKKLHKRFFEAIKKLDFIKIYK